jgi:isopenicillin-N epimerase
MNDFKNLFLLNDEVTFLNFGSFGATPRPVFEKYQSFQLEMERDPVQFITKRTIQYLKESREALASMIHAQANDLVMVTNPSYAVNTVAKSLELKAGDEILATNIEYGACDRTWDFVCKEHRAKYIRQHVTLPLVSDEQFVDDLFQGATDRTKMIFISHITSTTALIFPVEAVIQKAKTLNIPVFVDGAHAIGQISLNLTALDADFYTGACHKWLMTPKGSSFLHVKKSWQEYIKPLIVSWGYEALFPSDSKFIDWHQMNGTRDYTAMLCVPHAIAFRQAHDWDTVSNRARNLAYQNAITYSKLLQSPLLGDAQYIGQMVSAQIHTPDPEALYLELVQRFKIEIPVMRQDEKVYLRYSVQAFTDQNDLDTLFEAIETLKKEDKLMV